VPRVPRALCTGRALPQVARTAVIPAQPYPEGSARDCPPTALILFTRAQSALAGVTAAQ